MTDWTPPPEPLTWTITPPVTHGSTKYATVTLRAPTSGDTLKAIAVPGESGMTTVMRLISAVSAEGIPFEVLLKIPQWQIQQMADYMESFNEAPAPDPLESWRNRGAQPSDAPSS